MFSGGGAFKRSVDVTTFKAHQQVTKKMVHGMGFFPKGPVICNHSYLLGFSRNLFIWDNKTCKTSSPHKEINFKAEQSLILKLVTHFLILQIHVNQSKKINFLVLCLFAFFHANISFKP